MSRKSLWLCVLAACLLALAGNLLFARKVSAHHLASRYSSPQFLARASGRNSAARTASNRDIFPVAQKSTASLARHSPLSLPFAFEPNVGQADSRVAFVGRGRGLTVFLESHEIAVQIAGTSRSARAAVSNDPRTISMRLFGSAGFAWQGRERLRGETNYFFGNNPRRWRTHVPHFAEVGAANAAPGVGIVLYGNDEGVEYDLRVAPGADLSALRFKISGADAMGKAANGDILLKAGEGELRMRKPVAYQELARSGRASVARKRRADGAYILEADGSLGFRIGPHDPNAALIIDPSLSVAYATFLGGAGADVAASVALDGAGKVYVGGTTTSPGTFPGTSHTLGPGGGTSEFFIAKIDPTVTGANSLVYLTFLGGSQTQSGGLIAVTSGGSVALTGTTTSADFPVTDSSLPTNALTSGVGNDVAVSEIGPSGSTLVFSTLFGGSGAESQNGTGAIALDPSGDVYVASDTNTTSLDKTSADLPVTAGAYTTTWDGDESDGFLAIFTPPTQAGGAATLKYCSYLGTNALALVSVGGIAVDSTSSAYLAGGVQNATSAFPFTNAFQTMYGGGLSDAFLMKISPLAQGSNDLVYATLFGGSGTDQALAVALDTNSNPSAYVTGATNSTDFPTKSGFSTSLNPNATANAFLVVVGQGATGQTSLLYSTYLGGSAADAGQSLAVIAPNQVYVGGTTTSWDFPWHDNIQPFNGRQVAFVAKFDPTSAGAASLAYATPLGGTSSASQSGGAAGNAVAVNSTGAANLVYLAGATTSPDFPTAITSSGGSLNGSQPSCSSCGFSPPATDAFLAELEENPALEPAVTFNLPRLNFFSAATQYLGLTNTGESPLNIATVTLAGPNSADFSLADQSECTSQPLNPGGSCLFLVNFSPSGAAYETAVIRLTDNAPGSPQEFELLGVAPGLAASPVSVSFPAQDVGAASDPQQVTFTVVSPVKQTLTIDAAPSLGGANPGQFQLAAGGNPCVVGMAMNPTATCSVSAVFVPQAAGSFQSEIDASYHFSGDAEQQLVVPLAGSASVALSSSVSVVSSVNFGSQLAESAGTPQPITITNSATGPTAGPLTFTGVSVKGPSSGDFDITSNSCTSGSTPPGGTCTVQIAFRPLQASTCGTGSTRNATLSLSDNAQGSPQSVALTGTAEDFCFSAPSGQAASAPITPGETATYNLQVNSSSGFTGSVGLSCSVAPVETTDEPACALSTSTVNVSATTAGPFTVNVTTIAPTPTSTSYVPRSSRPDRGPRNLLGLAAILAAVAILIVASLTTKHRLGLARGMRVAALLLALAAGLAACGGGGSDPVAADPGTPLGTYTITVTATVTVSSTTVTSTIQLPLMVN